MFTIDDIEIFITTHNRALLLKDSILSLQNQTVKPLLITVLDNDSTDGTQQLVQSMTGVKYVKTFGFLGNFNKAREIVSKKYCMLFHDDDLLHPQYLEFALNALNTYPNVSLITTRYTEFFDGNPPKHINNIASRHYFYENGRNFAKMMYFCEIIAYATAIYRTEDFLSTPLEYEKYSKFNDWPFMVKIAQKGASVLFDDQSMFLVRRHATQDGWTHTNVPNIEQIVNWDLCFYDAIKPKFLTKEWFCFMKFANAFFIGKYRAFIPIEMQNKKLRAELVKCARNNGVYPVIFKIIKKIFPKIIDKMCKVLQQRIRKLFFVK